MRKLLFLLLLPLVLASFCQAGIDTIGFASGKSSITCSDKVSEYFLTLMDCGYVGIYSCQTVPVTLEQKGKSYVYKGGGLNVKYQPDKRKLTFKYSYGTDELSEEVFCVAENSFTHEYRSETAQAATIAASGVLEEDLNPERAISLTFASGVPGPKGFLAVVTPGPKKFVFKGKMDGLSYNYSFDYKKGILKMTAKGPNFFAVEPVTKE